MRPRASLLVKFPITDTFRGGAGSHFVRRRSAHCDCRKKIGRSCNAVLGCGRVRKAYDEWQNYGAFATTRRETWIWNPPLSRRDPHWKRSRQIQRERQCCLCRGNANCSVYRRGEALEGRAPTRPLGKYGRGNFALQKLEGSAIRLPGLRPSSIDFFSRIHVAGSLPATFWGRSILG